MLKSDILESIACHMEHKFGGEWKHEVGILGCSCRHVNFLIDGKEYVIVLCEVEDGHHFSEYLDSILAEDRGKKWRCNNDNLPQTKD